MRTNGEARVVLAAIAAALVLMGVRCGDGDGAPVDAPQTGAAPPASVEPAARDLRWAEPLTRPGLPNLHKVSDDLFRGAQPEPAGFAELKKLGIKTVVNLRKLHSDKDEIEESGLAQDEFNYVPIPMNAWNAEDEHIVAFLKVMADERNRPVFVHCQHGADRTGTMSAIYRMAFEGWSANDAAKEMVDGGFGFHTIWANLVEYVKGVDIARLKREAGMTE
jgi:protein tyrosine/serine phosphatase